MFTLTQYFGYMIKATLDPALNLDLFMENPQYREQYVICYPAFLRALNESLRDDLKTLESMASLHPLWQKPSAVLISNLEVIYKTSELMLQNIQVDGFIEIMLDKDTLYLHAALFIAHYVDRVKDQLFQIK